jgi:hypothetical protein
VAIAIPVQLHATDFSRPDNPEPTKKNDAHARNSTQTGNAQTVAVIQVESMPNTPTLIDNAVALDIRAPLSVAVAVVMVVVMVVVIAVRQAVRLHTRARRERVGFDESLLRGQSAERRTELAVIDGGIACVVDSRFVDYRDEMRLEFVPFEGAGFAQMHDETEEPALPWSVEHQLAVRPG